MAAAPTLVASVLAPRVYAVPSSRLTYQQELWGGLELAEKRIEEGRKTYREVQSFIEEMIDLELTYVKGFKKLSARQSQCTEGGRKASFALQDHCAQQTKATTNYFAEAAKLNKEREKGLAEVVRLKGRYYKVAREAELAKQQYEGAQNDSSIPTTKLVKLNATLQTVVKECETYEKLYAKAVDDFNALQEQHVQEMRKILNALEAMEESRIVTMKTIFEEGCLTWGGSFTHQPEALGAVQKIIKNIDGQKDIQNWLLGNRTGQTMPTPLVMEPWQPASKFRRDRSSSGNLVRFKFKPEGAGTVIVGTTSGVIPTSNSPAIRRRGEEAEEAENAKAVDGEEAVGAASLPRVQVLYPYEAEEEGELTIHAGDVITVLEVEDEGWWKGEIDGRVGSFPSNYVRPISALADSAASTAATSSSNDDSGGDSSDSGERHTTRQPRQHRGLPSAAGSLADFRSSSSAGAQDLASPPLSPSSSYTSSLPTSSPSLLTFLEQQHQHQQGPSLSSSSSPALGQASEGKRGAGKLMRTGGMRRIVKEEEEADGEDGGDDGGGGGGGGRGDVGLEQPRLGTLPVPVPVPVPGSVIMSQPASPLASPLASPHLTTGRHPIVAAEIEDQAAVGFQCVVLYAFEAENEDELTIRAGDVLRVTEEVEQWSVGVYPDGRTGMFPSNYVRRADGL